MKKEYQLNIFWLLAELNKGNFNIWEKLNADQKKAFSPFIVAQWMSSCKDDKQIKLLADFVNPYIFSLSKHPQLLLMLLAACNSKKTRRYGFIKMKKNKSVKKIVELLKEYYDYSTREALLQIELIDNNEAIRIAQELGWENDNINMLIKEFSDRNET